MRIFWLRGRGIECAAGPRASDRNGTPEDRNIHIDGPIEGSELDADISAIPAFKEAGLLGQPFLGKRVLRRYGGFGCGHDTQVCPLPGKERAVNGAVAVNRLGFITPAQLTGPPPMGAGPRPPYGGIL